MTGQIDDSLSGDKRDEQVDLIERIGFAEGLDLITLKERLQKHGVER